MNNKHNLIVNKYMNDFYNFSPDSFKDNAYEEAVKNFPKEAFVYLEKTKQIGVVEEVRPTADGPRIKVKNIGSIPIGELRLANSEEIHKFINRN